MTPPDPRSHEIYLGVFILSSTWIATYYKARQKSVSGLQAPHPAPQKSRLKGLHSTRRGVPLRNPRVRAQSAEDIWSKEALQPPGQPTLCTGATPVSGELGHEVELCEALPSPSGAPAAASRGSQVPAPASASDTAGAMPPKKKVGAKGKKDAEAGAYTRSLQSST
jgi:hypothetical protein